MAHLPGPGRDAEGRERTDVTVLTVPSVLLSIAETGDGRDGHVGRPRAERIASEPARTRVTRSRPPRADPSTETLQSRRTGSSETPTGHSSTQDPVREVHVPEVRCPVGMCLVSRVGVKCLLLRSRVAPSSRPDPHK